MRQVAWKGALSFSFTGATASRPGRASGRGRTRSRARGSRRLSWRSTTSGRRSPPGSAARPGGPFNTPRLPVRRGGGGVPRLPRGVEGPRRASRWPAAPARASAATSRAASRRLRAAPCTGAAHPCSSPIRSSDRSDCPPCSPRRTGGSLSHAKRGGPSHGSGHHHDRNPRAAGDGCDWTVPGRRSRPPRPMHRGGPWHKAGRANPPASPRTAGRLLDLPRSSGGCHSPRRHSLVGGPFDGPSNRCAHLSNRCA